MKWVIVLLFLTDEVFPAVEGVIFDVEKDVVEDSSPVVFGAEAAGQFDKFFAEDDFFGGGFRYGHPDGAGFADGIEGFDDEEEGEPVLLRHLYGVDILLDVLFVKEVVEVDVFAEDAGEADGAVSFGEGGEVVRHDRFAEAEADVIFLLVGDDEQVPLVE